MADKPLVTGKFDPTQLLGGATMAFGAAGNLLNGAGDMNAQDRGANIGTAVGGTIGSVAQAFIPIPGLGEMVGQVGGMVGTLASKGRARREANKLASDSASRTYGAFHEQSNVDPYGAGNSAYVADEGGMADMGLSMFMLNTKLPVKATVNPLDTKLMVEGGRAPGFLPPGSIEDEIQFREDGGVILNSGGGRFRAWAKARNLTPQEAADKIKRRRGKTSDPNAGSMFSTLNSETAIPIAQEGVFTSTKPKIIPRPKHTLNPVTPLFDKPEDRKAYQEYITSEAEKALQSGGDAKYLIETPYHPIYDEKGEAHNNCINGICGLSGGKLKWSNAPDQGRYLSNPDFSTNIQYGGEDYYQATDNFDVGDHVQLLNMYGHPFHSKMIYKVDRDEDGKKKYHVIHNGGGDTFKADVWSEEQLKNMVKVNETTGVAGALVYRPGKALDMPKIQADRDAANSPAVRKGAAERRAREAYTNERDLDYTYKMRDDYVDKDDAPQGVKMYMEFANNKSRLKDIANMMGVDLEDVHDELPNVLGQLMVENKGHRSPKTKDVDFFFTGAENLYEEMVLPSSKSIGPGQIRLDSLTPEMREKFGIKNEIDLYDFSKVIPLMLGINLENRKWMRRQGDKMSEKLIGIPGVKADDLKGGIGRWTPYLYQGLPADPTTKLKRELKKDANALETLTGGPVEVEDFDTYNTPENRRRVAYLNDEGSYADKVFHAANSILERTAPYVNDEKTLQEVVVKGVKKKRKGGLVDDVSKLGYSDDSPYNGAPFLDINTPSGMIDMSNTSQDLWGIDETGFTQFMKGGSPQMYKFPGKKVREIPKAQDGYINALGNSLFGKKPYTPSTPATTPKWLPYDRNAPMKQASDIGTMGIDPRKVIIKPEAKVTPVQTRPLVQSTDIESMSPLFKVAEQAELQQRMGPELRRQATIAATQEEIAKRKTVGDNTSSDRAYINSDLGKSERERLNRVYADKTEGVYYNEKTGEVEQTWWDRTKQENPKLVPGLQDLGHLALLATDIEGGLALGRLGLNKLGALSRLARMNESRAARTATTNEAIETFQTNPFRFTEEEIGNATAEEIERARAIYWRNQDPNQYHDIFTPRDRAIVDLFRPGEPRTYSALSTSEDIIPGLFHPPAPTAAPEHVSDYMRQLETYRRSATPETRNWINDTYRRFNLRPREMVRQPARREIPLYKQKPEPVRNASGYTKDDPLIADQVKHMTDEEFKLTVIKPDLTIGKYDMDYPIDPNNLSATEYLERLNAGLPRLNEIIASKNAPGNPKYWVKSFNRDGFTVESELGSSTDIITDYTPGIFRGDVQDINNVKYYMNTPGISMVGSSNGVYGSLGREAANLAGHAGKKVPPGTRLYESVNDYLKEVDLGRVKSGFGSQTGYSFGLWKDAVNKGKAVGYHGGMDGGSLSIYGMLRMGIPPLVLAGVAAATGGEEKKPFRKGGIVNNLNEEDMYTFLPGELPDSVVNQMGKGGATCSCQHKHGGMPHDVYAQGGMVDDEELMIPSMKKGGKWIQKAVNPAHKGYCTPMTKSTCTPRRKALARTFKKHHGFHKAQDGMMTPNDEGVYEQQGQEQPEGMEQQGAPEEQQQQQAPPQQQQPQQPQASVVNIEFGELVVDPQSGEIIKEFTNPSRYSLHADNPMKEPSGNFVTLPQNVVVIPRKLAKGYKEGNKLTRSTMLRQVLKDQMDREATGQQEYAPTGGDVPHAQQGWSDMSLLNTSLDPRTAEADALTKARTANAAITASINGTAPVVAGVRKYPAAPGYNPNQPFTPSSTMPAIPGGTKNFSDILKDKSANELYPGQDYWDKPAVERMGMTDLDRTLGRTPTAETRFSNLMDLPEDVVPGGPNGPKEETDKMSALPFVLESQFLPAGLQFLQSMQGNPDLKMHTNRGYGDARAAIGQMPTDVNYDAAKATVGRGQRARDRSYMNFRRPDIAGEMGVGYGEGINRLGQIEQDEYNQEQQAKGAKLQAMGQMSVAQGADLQAAEREFGLAKEQDAASKRTMMNSALSESTSRFAKYFMEGEKIKAGNLAAHFYKLDPFTQKMVVDQDKVEAYIASQAMQGFDLSYNTDLQTKAKKEGKG